MSERETVLAAVKMGSLAAKLAVMVLAAYQRDDEAAMKAFGTNGPLHVANDLSIALIRFKTLYQAESER